ncbi:MAG: magnesium transporter [Myxococcaceae bacterium]|nr:magnesium transporter [Myxococcaceae bacterium]
MLGHFLKPEYEELIAQKDWESLRIAFEDLHPADIAEVLDDLPPEDSGVIFRILPRDAAGVAFEYLPLERQANLVKTLGSESLVNVLNSMSPDDRMRLFDELPAEVTRRALTSLNPDELKAARQLLGYPEGTAGRFMTPEYLTIKPSMTAREAIDWVRANGRGRETINVLYVIDEKGVFRFDLRLGDVVLAPGDQQVTDIGEKHHVSLPATAPRADVIAAFEKYDRVALPVVDSKGVMLGIITIDDVLDVAEQEATEDIQKLGGMEALEAPYLEISLWEMLKKRGPWLTILLVSGTLTATAVSYFQGALDRAVVLGIFMPMVIASGGNSGSQATSLIIRALALRELELTDWWKVAVRELRVGAALGAFLAFIGCMRIVLWPTHSELYTPHFFLVGIVVSCSLAAIVLMGALVGAMLPFVLRRLGLDPATASAPFVATVVDVTGLVIYFTVAMVILRGTLL